jgi:photosystem II stability/assembly factor-like uncharacterized protein
LENIFTRWKTGERRKTNKNVSHLVLTGSKELLILTSNSFFMPDFMKTVGLFICLLLLGCNSFAQKNWKTLKGSPFNSSKQDDIFFLTPELGWSVNGSGEIHKTKDGGKTWKMITQMPGTYFRCIGFVDSLNGFAGNLAPGFFDGVTDINPLYRTRDGGNNWSMVTNIDGIPPTGLCAINIVNKNVIYAGGRVSGPTFILKSTDGGESWKLTDMSAHCEMIMDVWFFTPDTGLVFCGTKGDITQSSASILYTTNGGLTWTNRYTSKRIHEICWKAYFPTRKVGYTTILSYSETTPNRWVIKTTDGGLTWKELPFVPNGNVQFGIGFINEKKGWVGTDLGGYYTKNGGKKWKKAKVGTYTNKFRFIDNGGKKIGYAIGTYLHKWN